MKSFILFLGILCATQISWASPDQEILACSSVNYVITVLKDSDWNYCSQIICQTSQLQGNGSCEQFKRLGIVIAGLTLDGVEVLKNDENCSLSLREEDFMDAAPKLGTSN